MKIARTCIYPKDIHGMTGKSERYGRKMLNDAKQYFGKQSNQYITSEEFSEFSGIKLEIVNEYLQKVS